MTDPRSQLLAAFHQIVAPDTALTIDQLGLAEKMADAAIGILRPSFSDQIIRNGEIQRRCRACGKTSCVYRRTLRPCFVAALHTLLGAGPMTTGELIRSFPNPILAIQVKSHFAETQLWGFTEKGEGNRWRATDKAADFVNGRIRAHRHVWPRDVPLPEECVDDELVYVGQVTGEDFGTRRGTRKRRLRWRERWNFLHQLGLRFHREYGQVYRRRASRLVPSSPIG